MNFSKSNSFVNFNKISFILLKFFHSIFDFLIFITVFFYISGRYSGEDEFWITMLAFVSFCVPYLIFAAFNGSFIDKYSSVKAFRASSIVMLFLSLSVNYFFSLESVSALFILLFLVGANRSLYVASNFVYLSERFKDYDKSKAFIANQGLSFLALITILFLGAEKEPFFVRSVLISVSFLTVIISFLQKDVKQIETKHIKIDYFPLSIFKTFEKMKRHFGINISIYALSSFWALISIFCFVLVYRTCLGMSNINTLLQTLALLSLGAIVSGIATSFLFKDKVELGVIPLGAFCSSVSLFCFSFLSPDGIFYDLLTFLMGFSLSFFILPTYGYVQSKIPYRQSGRYNAAILMITVFSASIVVGLFVFAGFALGFTDKSILRVVSILSLGLTVHAAFLLPKLFLRCLVWALVNIVYKLKIIGIENVPKKGGAIIVCNHMSYLDPFIIMASMTRSVRFLIYDSIYNLKYVKPIAKILRAIPLPEKGSRETVLAFREAANAVKKGEIVVIFAEGQVSRVGNMLPFTSGFTRISKMTKAPVIPMYLDRIWGSSWILNDGKFAKSMPKELPYPLTIVVGTPIKERTDTYRIRRAVQELGADASKYKKEVFQLLHTSFIRSAKRKPFRKVAINATGLSLNYITILGMSLLISRKLKNELKNDKFVGIMIPPSVEAALVNISLYFIGKIPINLNYTAGNDFLLSVEKQTGMKKIITAKKVLEKLNKEKLDSMFFLEELLSGVKKSEKIKYVLYALLIPRILIEKIFLVKRPSRHDMATIIFSSGSTGDPKGVMLSHDNITSNIESILSAVEFNSSDGLVGILPFFHSFGYTVALWLPLLRGFKICYHNNPLDATTVGNMVKEHKLTVLVATGIFMATYIKKCDVEQFKSLRFVIAGAEKLQRQIAKDFEEKFGLKIYEGYGCTELSPVAAVNLFNADGYWKEQIGEKSGTVGRPMPQICAKITSLETGEELGPNEEGMLWIKGPNVMMGYYGKPELTKEVLKDGWYSTGDIAICDRDGFIKIVDRVSRFSKVAGEMVPHIKSEELIQEIYGSTERCCVVTGVPDGKKGEKLVVLHVMEDIDPKEISKELQARGLANLWIPKPEEYYKVDAFPVLSTGKLDLRGVKKLALDITSRN
ncbi:MAG: MFS transporter [Bdellovibrionota bacterium]